MAEKFVAGPRHFSNRSLRASMLDNIRRAQLVALQRREYAEVHRQEMARQRGAVDAWAVEMEERAERRLERLATEDQRLDDNRRF